jgi:hypothetical protein
MIVRFHMDVEYPHINADRNGVRDMEEQFKELRYWFGTRGGGTNPEDGARWVFVVDGEEIKPEDVDMRDPEVMEIYDGED